MKLRKCLFSAGLVCLLFALSARAATLVVTTTNDSGVGSLRQMVADAAAGSIITFTNTLYNKTILLTNGEVVLDKNVTIDGSSLIAAVLLDGNRNSRIFHVTNGAAVTLIRLIITNGVSRSSGVAGGIYNRSNCVLVLSNLVVTGNMAGNGNGGGSGGGIFTDGMLTMVNCILSNNLSASGGGGFYNRGTVFMNNSILVSNQAILAGASYNQGTVNMTNCTLTGNIGGGAFNNGGILYAKRCLFAANAGGYAGGLYSSDGTNTVDSCTVIGNTTDNNAGGLGNVNGALLMYNSTVVSNSVPGYAGGINNDHGTLLLHHCTVTGNSAGMNGGGIASTTNLLLTNSIVSLNYAGSATNISGSFVGTSNLVNVLALNLAPPGNYGGATPTMPPLPGSPAIDKGSDAADAGITTDQRGGPRLFGAHVDIGATEGVLNAAAGLLNPVRQASGSFQFTFTNLPAGNFAVLTSTNVLLPVNQWADLGPAVESLAGSGQYQFTDTLNTNGPRRYYRFRVP